MTIDFLLSFFLWSWIINTALLSCWFLFFIFAHNWLYRFHGRWFKLPVATFDTIHYAGMAFFKILIMIFNIAPFVVLLILG